MARRPWGYTSYLPLLLSDKISWQIHNLYEMDIYLTLVWSSEGQREDNLWNYNEFTTRSNKLWKSYTIRKHFKINFFYYKTIFFFNSNYVYFLEIFVFFRIHWIEWWIERARAVTHPKYSVLSNICLSWSYMAIWPTVIRTALQLAATAPFNSVDGP